MVHHYAVEAAQARIATVVKTVIAIAIALIIFGVPDAASADPTARFRANQTNVKFSQEFLGALDALNLTPSFLTNARFLRGTARFQIPVAEIDLETAKGEIWHLGGLRLENESGRKVVDLSLFVIDTTDPANAMLTGLVRANGSIVGRLPLFSVKLPTLQLPLPISKKLQIPGAELKLTETAATALNSAFGTTAFVGGFKIGSATVFLGDPLAVVRKPAH